MKTPLLLRILRFSRGYVRFGIRGKFPERFLNITARNRIRLWDVRRGSDGFTACMYSADYRRIRPFARGAGVKLPIKDKYGLPIFLSRFKEHTGVLIGASAFIIAVFVMSQFIWSVDISGLDKLSETEVTELLRGQGFYVGAFKPSLNYQGIARELMLQKHEIGWMAINVDGSYASVEIKEEAEAPEVEDISYPCNVKAKRDGVIRRIECAEGETVLTEGSGVIGGQLVVSGVKSNAQENGYRLVHAQARVIAQTEHEARFSVPQRYSHLVRGDQTAHQAGITLFGLCLPYRFEAVGSPYAVTFRETVCPAPNGVKLPVCHVDSTVCAMEEREEDLNDNSAKELLMRRSRLYELFSLPGCTVESREYRMIHTDGFYTLYVTYTCEEDIAYQEEIGVE